MSSKNQNNDPSDCTVALPSGFQPSTISSLSPGISFFGCWDMHPTPPLRSDPLSNKELDLGRPAETREEEAHQAQHPLPSSSASPSRRSPPSSFTNMDQPYDDGSATPPYNITPTKDPLPETTPPPINPFLHLPTASLLVFFSILGCLTRIGLTALFTYSGQAVFPLVWSQGLGCLLMGVCVGWRKDLERWGGRELYFGLGTGPSTPLFVSPSSC